MDTLSRGAFNELLEYDENLEEKAAVCGHKSFIIMAGALDGINVESKALSHQDITGVGYGVCTYTPKEKNKDTKKWEERYNEFTRKRESEIPLSTHDFTVVKGGTLTIDSIKLEEVENNEYKYEVTVNIDNLTEKLETTYTGLLKINDEGLIDYDWMDKRIGVTKKIE